MDLGPGVINEVLEASFGGNTKLTSRNKVRGKVIAMDLHDILASNPAKCRPHGDGSEFGGVSGILVKGHEVIGRNGWGKGGGHFVVEDQAEDG